MAHVLGSSAMAKCLLQLLASMAEAMATVSQASTALTTSIHQAASWLGARHSQSATPVEQQQVSGLISHILILMEWTAIMALCEHAPIELHHHAAVH